MSFLCKREIILQEVGGYYGEKQWLFSDKKDRYGPGNSICFKWYLTYDPIAGNAGTFLPPPSL